MIAINARQRAFYESVRSKRSFVGASKSIVTSAWSSVRNRVWSFGRDLGIRDSAAALHRRHLAAISTFRVLDLGCGTGSDNSLWLAENAKQYTGIDLSPVAVDDLNRTLSAKGLTSARALACDFLNNDFPSGSFDVIYAMSVLHHFRSLDIAVAECKRLLRPGGILLSLDPLKTDPFNRIARVSFPARQTVRSWTGTGRVTSAGR